MGKVRFSLLNTGVETLGDWNPQLMREIQGRLKLRSVLFTLLGSFLGQGLFLFWRYRTLELRLGSCETADFLKKSQECVQAGTHYFFVNWQEWWLQVFTWGCIFLMFGLVVGGSFMLISDLSQEDRQGTLTFISLSPQTAQTILVGKMIGVPLLIFLAALLVLPLHYGSGLLAQIPFAKIVCFDLWLLAGSFFFYSLALLLGLVGNWLSGFQSWLGSAGIFMLLLLLKNSSIYKNSADWLYAFSPTALLPYVTNTFEQNGYGRELPFAHKNMVDLHWFTLPLGNTGLLMLLFALINYGLWSGWLWQPLQRRFRNPHISLLSKKQSYWATTCFITCSLKFSVYAKPSFDSNFVYAKPSFDSNMVVVLMTHLLWFLLLIVLLLPHHQALEDWARFRGDYQSAKGRRQRIKDLIWADDSPTWVAIAINLGIAGIPIMAWMLVFPQGNRVDGAVGLLFNSTLILIFALFNQVMLLRSISHRNLWTTATLLGPVILPIFLLAIFGVQSGQWGESLFFLTPFAFTAIKNIAFMRALQIFLLHLGLITGLTWQLNRQLKRSGESTTQRLLRGDKYVEQG
ncbi:MAG: hypothetical protein HC934_08745 [Acaryochloridaceae cyanobacterium SU_2_1]|nr:hypothetical protein [Acaryochloridaceae cyanobacterium SU_2_1]